MGYVARLRGSQIRPNRRLICGSKTAAHAKACAVLVRKVLDHGASGVGGRRTPGTSIAGFVGALFNVSVAIDDLEIRQTPIAEQVRPQFVAQGGGGNSTKRYSQSGNMEGS